MPTFETLLLFSAAAIAITLVPGPSMLYVASRSVAQGRSAGIWSAFGLATGLLIHTASAGLGLSAIFTAGVLDRKISRFYLSHLPWNANVIIQEISFPITKYGSAAKQLAYL